MLTFDFVTNDALRASLEADAAEMQACLGADAYKAVVVLAGSIVEAVLMDHLESVGYKDEKGTPLDKLDLGGLIVAARSQKVLSTKSADLSSAVKNYRNLIHPGRRLRLGEGVDADSAAIAGHVVQIVASEIAALKRDTYGYTSQQILTKVENDSSSTAILPDLIKDTKPKEMERLLTHDLPGRYMELAPLEDQDFEFYVPILDRLRRAYRTVFTSLPDEVKARVMKEYARVLREEASEFQVLTRERAFFRAEDLRYMTPDDVAMTKRHLLSQVGRTYSPDMNAPLIGIGHHMDAPEVASLIDAYLRTLLTGDAPAKRKNVSDVLQRLYSEVPVALEEGFHERMRAWETTWRERKPDLADWVAAEREKMAQWLDDLPF